MSDMHRARKADSISDRVSSIREKRSALSGERSVFRKTSWQDFAQGCGSEDETKNFVVPDELIALARANLSGPAPARAPFAAKPTLVVPIVVPPAAIPAEKRLPTPAPAAPVEARAEAPVTTLKAKVAPVRERLARASSQPHGSGPSQRPPPFEPWNRPASSQPGRHPPALEAWRPAPASSGESSPESGKPSPLRVYAPFLTTAVIVGAYVGLCYFANALVAWLP
jgi:hypothetical protein